jgi:hypothetical protein
VAPVVVPAGLSTIATETGAGTSSLATPTPSRAVVTDDARLTGSMAAVALPLDSGRKPSVVFPQKRIVV